VRFACRLANGGESLFQAKDEDEMMQWVNKISAQCEQSGSAGPSRAQTLPASSDRKEDSKRRSFFTLKKK